MSLVALAATAAVAVYQLYRSRTLKLNPLKDEIYKGTKPYERVVEENR